jgi:hypothetical protein
MVRRRSTVRFRNGAPQELTCKARSEALWTALILRGAWELFPCWEESGRSGRDQPRLGLPHAGGPDGKLSAKGCLAGAARNGASRLSSSEKAETVTFGGKSTQPSQFTTAGAQLRDGILIRE